MVNLIAILRRLHFVQTTELNRTFSDITSFRDLFPNHNMILAVTNLRSNDSY